MKESEINPETNKLGQGVEQEKLEKAITTSGYPLQTIVASLLASNFYVQEEWSFTDPDTKDTRTIDLLAERPLYDFEGSQPRVRPTLNLIIECKQSELPYVFFLSHNKPIAPQFPVFAGLASDEVVITSDDDPSSWHYSIPQALEMYSHPFLSENPEYSSTFSKCVRKGKNLELSGSQPYQGLVFPIIKAVSHFKNIEAPPSTAMYFDCHLTIGIGVLDSPMVGVRVKEAGHDMILLPWVRVLRHQTPAKGEGKQHRNNTFAFDVIHKDFLPTYIDRYLMPFAEYFSKLALKHQDVLASNKGFVSGMGSNSWTDIEKRLETSKIQHKAKRIKATGKRFLDLISGNSNDKHE